MDKLNVIASFLKDLIRPIVVDAVTEAVTPLKPVARKRFLTVKEAREEYCISTATLYNYFQEGVLHKIKNGGRTYIDREELEANMHVRQLCSIDAGAAKGSGK